MSALLLAAVAALRVLPSSAAVDERIPSETDVLVVGGTLRGVETALAERAKGKSVYLVTPFTYLGEDLAGTLELGWGEEESVRRAVRNGGGDIHADLLAKLWTGATDQAPYDYWVEPEICTHPAWIYKNDRWERFSESGNPPSAADVVIYDDDAKMKCVLRKTSKIATVEVLVAESDTELLSEFGAGACRIKTGKIVGTILEGERKGEEFVFERKGVALKLAGNHNGGGAVAVSYVAKVDCKVKKMALTISKAPGAESHELSRVWFHLADAERSFDVPSPLKVKRTLDRALVEAGVGFLTGTAITGVLRDDAGRRTGVTAVNRSGETTFRARQVIDATRYGTLDALERGGFAVGAEETFTRVIIVDGEPPSAPGMTVERLPHDEYRVAHTPAAGKVYRCTMTLPMKDGSPASFAAAEWKARELTWTPCLMDDADLVVWVKSERVKGEVRRRTTADSYDVVVVGGGTSGTPAAVGAGRAGAKTLLVEFLNVLGGTGTDGMILGYYDGNHCGFTEEFKRHNKETKAKYSLYPRAETWREMCQAAGVEVRLGTMGIGVVTEADRVVGVKLASEFGTDTVRAASVVDGTGNSDIAAAAGARTEFLSPGEFALQSAGQAPHRLARHGINSDFGYLDDSSAWDLWLFGLRARAGAPDAWDLAKMPDSRERRRVISDLVLSAADVAANRTFPDTVVQSLSRQDAHGYIKDLFGFVAEDSVVRRKLSGRLRAQFPINVPLRALLPRGIRGLAVVGLGAGCERDVIPMVRMQADLMNMGYSVGTAAAQAAREAGGDFRAIDLARLKEGLVKKGILRPETLGWTADTDETSDARIAEAVRTMADGFRGSHVVWRPENRARALPLLRAAYAAADSDMKRQIYAVTLGLLGDAAGVDTLVGIVDGDIQVLKTRKGGNFGEARQGGDTKFGFVVALGRTRDKKALAPLLKRLEPLSAASELSDIRAVTLALEALGDPAAARPLADVLRKPGVGGHAVSDWRTLPPQGGYGVGPELQKCIVEIAFARALLASGDCEGLARRTLEAYAADPRGVLSAHAKAVLAAAPPDEIEKLARRFAAFEASGSASNAGASDVPRSPDRAKRWAGALRADGTWADVDYVTNERGYCPKVEHLHRMRALAVVGEDAAYRRALAWWLRNRPANPNWWWNEIGFPQALGEGAVIARETLSAAERAGVCEILKASDACVKRTGQNHVWVARIKLMRAMLERDEALAREAVGEIESEIALGDCEGIRSDWCFHQHGRQPQFGNYGLSFAAVITRLTAELDGTAFAFAPEKRRLLRGLLENGFRWICWKGRMDVSALGRQIVPNAQCDKARTLRRTFAEYAKIDPTFPTDEPRGFRYFDKSAYAVYRAKDWMASVRMATTEIVGAETGINSENVRGGNLCDGALLVYVTGREYENVTPLWKAWRHVPGITGYEDDTPFKAKGSGIRNGSDEVFGREEDGAGVVTMKLEKEGLTAFKSWRFSEKGVLCEGRGITSDDPREVITPVEECWACDNAKLLPYDGTCVRAVNGTVVYEIEARPEDVRFAVEERAGDFRLSHPAKPSHPVKGRVFSLTISHGVRPKGATYRYRVLPQGM